MWTTAVLFCGLDTIASLGHVSFNYRVRGITVYDTDVDEVVLSFRHLDLRLSEAAVRKLFESLPPEMLSRL